MQVTPQIHFRDMEPSPSVEAVIRERIDRLARFHDRITSCKVVVKAPHRRGRHGKIFQVRVDVKVPGRTIVSGRLPEENHAHEDVYVALRDSFDAVQRRLEDVVRTMSGHRVKAHPQRSRGTVSRLVRDEGFGFITGSDGREFFFRRESLTSARHWDALSAGDPVHFVEHDGGNGLHATAVTPK
jgi:ribosomal subunit interface protein